MAEKLSKSISKSIRKGTQVVQRHLTRLGVDCRIVQLPVSTRTAAKVIGCQLGRVLRQQPGGVIVAAQARSMRLAPSKASTSSTGRGGENRKP